jgi:hypothetical protein
MKTQTLIALLLLCAASVSAQIPGYNSYPGAPATIYLDFDGQHVTGTAWNWGGPITAQPAPLSNADITEIFNRVAEDYRIFNINITTDSAVYNAAPLFQRARIIVTPSSAWYGNAGGVAYVGSFTWGDNTPGWVFSNLLGNNVKYIAEACSHEAGHTLGLQHQSQYNTNCSKIAEYNGGQGSGEIGWAPIMGVGYYKNLTTWHNGTNATGCNVYQRDIDIIADTTNGFGFRTDDHSDRYDSATNINVSGLTFNASGLVNQSTDKDVFRIFLTHTQNLKLTVVPQNVGSANAGANVDIQMSLLDGDGDTIGRYNPSLLLNAGIDTNLAPGPYYLVAEGTGNVNLSDYGSLGYYVLNGALNNALPVERFRLSGSAANGVHALNWSYVTNEDIASFELQSSGDGLHFEQLMVLRQAERNAMYKPLSQGKVFYRIKAITPDERSYYSNIIALKQGQGGKPALVMNTLVNKTIAMNSTGPYEYQLLGQNGQLVQSGKLVTGYNNINVRENAKGVLFLHIYDGNEHWTEKLIRQ